jgi:hypothetical protein
MPLIVGPELAVDDRQPTPRAKRMAWAYPLGIVIMAGAVLWFLFHLGAQIVKGVQDLIPSSG